MSWLHHGVYDVLLFGEKHTESKLSLETWPAFLLKISRRSVY